MFLNSNQELIKSYQNSFFKYGDTPAGVQWPKGRQNLRFEVLTSHLNTEKNFSILDYGCGLGHLNEFLKEKGFNYDYEGVDVVPEFIKEINHKYSDINSRLINSYFDLEKDFDNILISGTFNIIVGKDRSEYLEYIKDTLIYLFNITKYSLAVNFLTDKVDYKQANSLHVNMNEMIEFFRKNLSPRIISNSSYMPYEFSLIVFKNYEIVRPHNVYENNN